MAAQGTRLATADPQEGSEPALGIVDGLAFEWQRLWSVLRPTRIVPISLLFGFFLLFVTGQGRSIMAALTVDRASDENGGLLTALGAVLLDRHVFWFWAGVLFWAAQCRHWSSVALHFARRQPDRRSGPVDDRWAERLPGIYFLAVHLLAAAAVIRAQVQDGIGWQDAALVLSLLALTLLVWLALGRVLERYGRGIEREMGDRATAMWHSAPTDRGAGFFATMAAHAPVSLAFLLLSLAFFVVNVFVGGYLPVEVGYYYGAAGIVFGALGTWVSFGSLLAIASSWSRWPILGLVVLFLLGSNWLAPRRHEVRSDPTTTWSDPASDPRPELVDMVGVWRQQVATLPRREGPQPVVFVASAGGGLRAAYWTSAVLSQLERRYPELGTRAIAMSGVSGGSVGATAHVAIRSASLRGTSPTAIPDAEKGQLILGQDFLAPALASMLYTDAIGPWLAEKFCLGDRAAALENAWSAAWNREIEGKRLIVDVWTPFRLIREAFGRIRDCYGIERTKHGIHETTSTAPWHNPLDSRFLELWQPLREGKGWVPMLFLNATHEEEGKRVVTSNVRLDRDPFTDAWDLHRLLRRDLGTATAMHNSARFPFVSPAGAVLTVEDPPQSFGHVIDGGYFENFGAVTLGQVIEATMRTLNRDGPAFVPVIVQISSDPGLAAGDLVRTESCALASEAVEPGPTDDPSSFLYLANELLAPFRGMIATREARGIMATRELARIVGCADGGSSARGVFVHLAMCGLGEEGRAGAPPLGWSLDRGSREAIDALIPDAARALDEGHPERDCNARELGKLDAVLARR